MTRCADWLHDPIDDNVEWTPTGHINNVVGTGGGASLEFKGFSHKIRDSNGTSLNI